MSESKLSPSLMELASIEQAGSLLAAETRLRPSTTITIPILDNTLNFKEKRHHFGAPGTVTIFIARNAASLARVHRAAETGGEETIEIVKEILAAPLDQSASLEQALNNKAASPVIATLMYGGRPLVEYLTIPEGLDLIGLTLPYNGGRIAAKGMELMQSVSSAETPLYSGVALSTMPELTPAETLALSQLSETDLNLNIGPSANCSWACGVAFASGALAGGALGVAIGGGAVGAGVGGILGGLALTGAYSHVADAFTGGLPQIVVGEPDAGADGGVGDAAAGSALNWSKVIFQNALTDAQVKALGSVGTAKALLEMRRAALLKDMMRR